jgi:hypothetical protein
MVLSTKHNPFREALKKSKTIKNKRKSKSRTHRITRSKNLKGGGGGVIDIFHKMYNFYTNPSKQCVAFAFDSSKKIAGLPNAIKGLYSYVEIAKQLLKFYSRINIDALNLPLYFELDQLKLTFTDTMEKLKKKLNF